MATHLQDHHCATQLLERLVWAAIDAAQLESPTDREHRGLQRTRNPVSSRPRPIAGRHRDSP